MALTATLTIQNPVVQINQKVKCFLTISNTGANALNVIAAYTYAVYTGGVGSNKPACAYPNIDLGPGSVTQIPANTGSITFPFQIVFFAPSSTNQGSGTYSIGAVVTTSDGVNTSPTLATVTVNPLPLPASEQ